jgi:cyclase
MEKINASKVRIIPKLEIKNNFLIKGVKFEGLKKIGDPVVFAKKYYEDFADQINIIDIVASLYSRDNIYDIIDKITNDIFIPVNVGGGITDIDHIKKLLNVGADRIIVNSSALRNSNFLIDVKNIFGDQFLTVSIEAKKIQGKYYCMMDHGRENSNIEVKDWVKQLNEMAIGEIILNSIDHDGMKNGFEISLINEVYDIIKCPLVVSGGGQSLDDFSSVLSNFKLDGLCSSTALHFNDLNIVNIKKHLKKKKFL